MDFWSKLGRITESVLSTIATEGAKRQTDMYRNAERQLKDYERKVQHAENSSSTKSHEQQMKIKDAREKLDIAKAKFYGALSSSNEESTLNSSNLNWINIGPLENANLTPYNHCVGIYRHVIDGRTMYVGRAIELNNGGFRKRLSDYRRSSDSTRAHTSGQMINKHLSEITTYILIVGDTEEAVELTKKLEGEFIAKYNPPWNYMKNI